MAKKSVKKKSSTSSKTSSKKSSKKSSSDENVNKILVENLVSLQKVLTNLSVKFDSLTKRLDGMVDLFEESAKTVVKGEVNAMEDSKHTKKVLEKMDKLFDQNKLIARGLTLINNPDSEGSVDDVDDDSSSEDSRDFDASPSVKSSPYAMPYTNPSDSVPVPSPNKQGGNNSPQQPNSNPKYRSGPNGSQGNNRNFGRNNPSQQGISSFSPPKPSKVIREEDSEENSEENIPKSPPFNNF